MSDAPEEFERRFGPRFRAYLDHGVGRTDPDGVAYRVSAERAPNSSGGRALWGTVAVVALTLLVALQLRPQAPITGSGSSSDGPTPTSSGVPSTSEPSPATSTPEPSSLDIAAGLTYFCGNGQLFDPAALTGPATAEQGPDPAAAPVTALAIRFGLTPTHWWLVYRSPTLAQFLGRTESGTYDYVLTQVASNGTWGFKGAGDCQMKYYADGQSTLSWWVDPANPAKPGDSEIHVIVVDPCEPSPLSGRMSDPIIRYNASSILIALTARRATATSDVCSNGPALAMTLHLVEMIGSRTLLDGSTWPPREPHVPSP